MIKVLIADADTDVIKNFHTYIKSTFPTLKNISVINDPTKDILDTIRAIKPALIIADIRFFGLSNYHKIRTINEKFPDVRFVLYGTYNDSEYMKKAMEFGVIDYMYRPIKQADLHKCLENVISYFKTQDERNKKEQAIIESCSAQKQTFETFFLSNLVGGQLKNETEIFYTFKYFDISLSAPFTVFIVHIDHYKKVILSMDEMEKHILIYKILQVVKSKLGAQRSKAFVANFNAVNVILSGEVFTETIVSVCETIKKAVFTETGVRVTLGIGRAYEKVTDVNVSYREALGALRYRFHMGYNSVIHILFAEPVNNITYTYPAERETRLVYTAAIGEYEYSVTLLREIFDALKRCQPLPEMYLSKVIMNILISINRNLGEQNIKIQSQFTSFFPSKEVLELGDDIDVAFDYLSVALKNFCTHIVNNRAQMNKELVNNACACFDENHYESNPVLTACAKFSTSSEYLNKIFVEIKGITTADYISNARIFAAKQLLRETKFDDDMVAIKVGYDDGRIFRATFARHEGITTNEYRGQFR